MKFQLMHLINEPPICLFSLLFIILYHRTASGFLLLPRITAVRRKPLYIVDFNDSHHVVSPIFHLRAMTS
jgi:hypothetical protein